MSALNQCKNCGFEEAGLFCPQCGELVGGAEFSDQESLQKSASELKSFIALAKEPVQKVPAPNEKVQDCFDEMSKIKHLLELYAKDEADETQLKGFIKEANNFLNQDSFLEIAFVGTIKAGKSTLINALLKAEYASTAVTPETATLTKFKWGAKPEMQISFYTSAEWEEIFKDAKEGTIFRQDYETIGAEQFKAKFIDKEPIVEEFNAENLAKYSSSQHAEHFFIKEVLISYPEFPYEKNIMFVDTPGLDDPVPYRSQITKDYISQAKVVLVCNSIDAMKNDEMRTIYGAFDKTGGKPEKVYVLGTRYDNLNKPKEEWEKQKAEWSKYLTNARGSGEKEYSCYTKELANKNIIAVSAYTALLCELYKQKTLDDERVKELKSVCYKIFSGDDDIDANFNALFEFSNVGAVSKRIDEDILDKAQDIYNEGVKVQFNNLKNEVSEYFAGNVAKKQETYETLVGGLEAINTKIQREQNELEKLQNAQKEIENIIAQFETQSKETLQGLGKQIEELIEQNA